MKELLFERLERLLCVKALVTLILTAVFAVLACTGEVSKDFMTVYTVVIAFYFGTQTERAAARRRVGQPYETDQMPADGK